jgi:hypothetical protein
LKELSRQFQTQETSLKKILVWPSRPRKAAEPPQVEAMNNVRSSPKGFLFRLMNLANVMARMFVWNALFSIKTISEWSEQILAVFPRLFLLPENPQSKSEHGLFEIRY